MFSETDKYLHENNYIHSNNRAPVTKAETAVKPNNWKELTCCGEAALACLTCGRPLNVEWCLVLLNLPYL